MTDTSRTGEFTINGDRGGRPVAGREAGLRRPNGPTPSLETVNVTRFTRSRLAAPFAIGALVLATIASAAGLLIPHLYRDTESWVRQAQASDVTTIALAVPVLGIGMWRARRGSALGYLLTLGALSYLAYGYAIFSFAVATNAMTPLHYAILGLGAWSLVLHVVGIDLDAIDAATVGRVPRRTTGWFLIGVAGLFVILWGGQIAASIVSGTTTPEVAALGLTTNPVWALDLAFALPFLAFAGSVLLRGRRHATIAALPALVFSAVMGLSILAIFALDVLAGQRVDIMPVALVGSIVAVATVLVATCVIQAPSSLASGARYGTG